MRNKDFNLYLLKKADKNLAAKDIFGHLHRQQGVTLTEMLTVISVLAIICAVALMQFGSSRQQLKRQNVAQELKSAFERARFDSVKRRVDGSSEQAKVIIDANSFTLVTDVNQNGVTTDAGDSVVTNFSTQNISITSALTLPATVVFNKRGEVLDSSGVSFSPSFLVCNPSCSLNGTNSNANSSNANLVLVTPTGTVNLLAGGAPIPNFAAPSPLSNVPHNSGIKCGAQFNSNVNCF